MGNAEKLKTELGNMGKASLAGVFSLVYGNKGIGSLSKSNLIDGIARFFMFTDQAEFDLFLSVLEPWKKDLLAGATYGQFVPIAPISEKFGKTMPPLVVRHKVYSYYDQQAELNTAAHPFLALFDLWNNDYVALKPVFPDLFRPFLPRPDGFDYQPGESDTPAGRFWSLEPHMAESLPLLAEAIVLHTANSPKAGGYADTDTKVRKGLLKGDIRTIRQMCGLPEFPLSSKMGLDPIDMFFRLSVAFGKGRGSAAVADTDAIADADSLARRLVELFFTPPVPHTSMSYLQGGFFEFYVLNRHLSIRQIRDARLQGDVPGSRVAFRAALQRVAVNGHWHDVNALYRSDTLHGVRYAYADAYTELYGLRIKGDGYNDGLVSIKPDPYADYLPVYGPARDAFLGLPLFRAYWYVMATLGVVEIVEAPAAENLVRVGKKKPVSPFDALTAVRITDFGAWCLGLRDARTAARPGEYETVVDRDLLLVTFRGTSLSRKLFLEQIGSPLGSERFRINEDSFVRGCTGKKDVLQRIARFHALISPDPPERWKQFFSQLEARAGAIDTIKPAYTLDLGTKPDMLRALLSDRKIRTLCILAEGHRLVVPEDNMAAFERLARTHGFFIP